MPLGKIPRDINFPESVGMCREKFGIFWKVSENLGKFIDIEPIIDGSANIPEMNP